MGDLVNEDMSLKDLLIPLPMKTNKPTEILECDQKTGDNHVARDSRLIRLTGIHPFNSESPLSDLYDSGFLTPTELWFVRNHGSVPKIFDEDIFHWTFSIEGLVENPLTIKLNELIKNYRQVTLPITLVCAGNRRKEQNLIRKGKGFNWGSAGVSTGLFTGVLINEVLSQVKIKEEGMYMCMEGADQLPNGNYGTSIRLSIAMNPLNGIMLAYKMNGELLTPDHGRPLRIVIPGQVGGRSVKWLKKIIITDKPSKNWYHIHDNRVLPTMLTPDMVDKDKSWWNDERYAIYNINIQSVICYPAHKEIIQIENNKYYNIRGYAYNGGGIRVGRVEISLDQGKTWKLTDINYPEDLYRKIKKPIELFGGLLDMSKRETCFCWCFWNIFINIKDLCQAKDIVIRAMDENMNIQPRDMYWNVLSQLNNCWFRLTIEKNDKYLIFHHPCLPALNKGGWMEDVISNGLNIQDGYWGSYSIEKENKLSNHIQMINNSINRIITEDELSLHQSDGDAWFAVNGNVYDVSEFLKDHPGGADSIILASGTDATEDFLAIHSDTAKAMLIKYHIGILQKSNFNQIFLDRKKWLNTKLKEKKIINHDTVYLTFQLDHPNQLLGVPIGKHLLLRCRSSSGQYVIRPYTPISPVDQQGQFQLIIKLYKYPQNEYPGKMSLCIDQLEEGDIVQCKGPFGDIEYQRNGILLIKGKKFQINKLTMIAGGSGITPIYQIFRYASIDDIQCNLIYCNKTEDDILLRDELNHLKQVQYCLSRPTKQWNGLIGHISKDIIGDKHHGFILCCGPPQMEQLVANILTQIHCNLEKELFLF